MTPPPRRRWCSPLLALALALGGTLTGCGDSFGTSLPSAFTASESEGRPGGGVPTTVPHPARVEDSPQLDALPDLGLGDDATVVGTDLAVADLPRAVRALTRALGDDVELVELSISPFGIEMAVRESPGASRLVDYDWDPDDGLSEPGSPRPEDGPWFRLDGVDLDAPAVLVDEIQRRVPGSNVDDVTLDLGVFDEAGLAWRFAVSSPVRSFQVRARPDGTVVAIVV